MPIYNVLHSRECLLFRNELRALLKASGFTQIQLSEKLHQPQSYISKCLSGHRRIGVTELYQICRILDVSVTEFISTLEPRWDEIHQKSAECPQVANKKSNNG